MFFTLNLEEKHETTNNNRTKKKILSSKFLILYWLWLHSVMGRKIEAWRFYLDENNHVGEKCEVPDEEEGAIIYEGKGKRISA